MCVVRIVFIVLCITWIWHWESSIYYYIPVQPYASVLGSVYGFWRARTLFDVATYNLNGRKRDRIEIKSVHTHNVQSRRE